MSGFELVFALFGLLLGLAIAEILAGFARVLKLRSSQRARVRIGWLTPLLGAFVILDQTRFWLIAWNLREVLPANYLTLIAVLAIVGTYYLVSTLIFPDEPEVSPDFDRHYDQHNRLVLSGMLLAQLAVVAISVAVAAGAFAGAESTLAQVESRQGGTGAVRALLPAGAAGRADRR